MTHQTMMNTSLRVIGRGEINSNISNPPANKLLAQNIKRTIIFLTALWISSMFFACWALIVIQAINAPNAQEIINWTVVVAQAVSLLVNAIFVFLYLSA